jgi:hypothetical protein
MLSKTARSRRLPLLPTLTLPFVHQLLDQGGSHGVVRRHLVDSVGGSLHSANGSCGLDDVGDAIVCRRGGHGDGRIERGCHHFLND